MTAEKKLRIGVIGLGYVGLPIALGFARAFPGTVGFDIDKGKVDRLRRHHDATGEVSREALEATDLRMSSDVQDLKDCNFFVVAVPTPINRDRTPDLRPLVSASETVGRVLKPGDIVVYESTVFPGATEEVCGPVLGKVSGLDRSKYRLGYSPERINPGDREHILERVIKIVSGQDAATLEIIAGAYGAVVPAGVHKAPSIRVAEAAKVIENSQRDLNIAFMNEIAIIFDRMGIRSADVLAAARTKWNFLPFAPGLVGGHCIGVDPYYLTAKAQELGYHPQVILAGRQINDNMGAFIAQRLIKLLVHTGRGVRAAKVGILGLTFKENVRDLRNSRVPDIVAELRQFGIEPIVHDPLCDPHEAKEEYGLTLADRDQLRDLDGLVLAVAHKAFLEPRAPRPWACLRSNGVLMDVKSVLVPTEVPSDISYWSL